MEIKLKSTSKHIEVFKIHAYLCGYLKQIEPYGLFKCGAYSLKDKT